MNVWPANCWIYHRNFKKVRDPRNLSFYLSIWLYSETVLVVNVWWFLDRSETEKTKLDAKWVEFDKVTHFITYPKHKHSNVLLKVVEKFKKIPSKKKKQTTFRGVSIQKSGASWMGEISVETWDVLFMLCNKEVDSVFFNFVSKISDLTLGEITKVVLLQEIQS